MENCGKILRKHMMLLFIAGRYGGIQIVSSHPLFSDIDKLIFFIQCFMITHHSALHHCVCVQLLHVLSLTSLPVPFLLPSPPFPLPPPSRSCHLCIPVFFSLMLSFIPLLSVSISLPLPLSCLLPQQVRQPLP